MTRICLTGATGFVGRRLLKHLSNREDIQIVALTRNLKAIPNDTKQANVVWKHCDAFSFSDVLAATTETDILIYLIHSMLPTAALSQGRFDDFDLYLADNFARAAKVNHLKKIIYLGGLTPNQSSLSLHLKSRLEVESILENSGVSVTTLRAGLIVGAEGSSFKILERLVQRLPVSVCPAWTQSRTQPIDIKDVLTYIEYCLNNFNSLNSRYDIGGPDVISYRDMLVETARTLNKKRYFINVPFFSPALSKLWVSKITSSPSNLVYPLVESLKYDMIVDPSYRLKIENHSDLSFRQSLIDGLLKSKPKNVSLRRFSNLRQRFSLLKNVVSIQRIKVRTVTNTKDVALEYFNWLSRTLYPLLKIENEGNKNISFYLLFRHRYFRLLYLNLQEEVRTLESSICRFKVSGGILVKLNDPLGTLEFRYIEPTNSLLIALIDYRPSLPWFIYKFTQAKLHLFIMHRFGHYLSKLQTNL